MGALIQTKGTQRLAKLLNNRFDDSGTGIDFARTVKSSSGSLLDAFANAQLDLLTVSDMFIAQNAVSGSWTTDLNDFLYPSATLKAASAVTANNVLTFTLPTGITALGAGCVIAKDAKVCSLAARKSIPKGTTVSLAPTLSGSTLTVTLSGNVTVAKDEMISFAKGNHERLVRRWRWYLKYDLSPANHAAIKRAISAALSDNDFDFKKITFQTVEDMQDVLVTTQKRLNNNDEFDDAYLMHVLLKTQATSAPDPLDPQ
jgi:hypothetical protein